MLSNNLGDYLGWSFIAITYIARYVLILIRSCQIMFQNDCTIVYSHQQSMRDLVTPYSAKCS